MSQESWSDLWNIGNRVHCEVQTFKGAYLKFLASVSSEAEWILKDVEIEVAEYCYSPKHCNSLKWSQCTFIESVVQNGTLWHPHIIPGHNHYWTFCVLKIQIWTYFRRTFQVQICLRETMGEGVSFQGSLGSGLFRGLVRDMNKTKFKII